MNDYLVVTNGDDQHSVWPGDRELPAGWTIEGFAGTREECLAHIDEVWQDMRPRGARSA